MNNYLKCFITLWVLTLSYLPTHAQLLVGAKVGGNFNQFSEPGTTIGFSAGAYASYQLFPFLTVKVEPQFSQAGGGLPDRTLSFNNTMGNIDQIRYSSRTILFQNIEFPLLAELSLPEFSNEKIVPKLIVGGSYALMAKADEIHRLSFLFNDGTPQVDANYQYQTVTDNFSRNQFSTIVGFGLQFKTEKRDFQLDFRYRQGLTQVNRVKFPEAANANSSVQIDAIGGDLYTSSFSVNFSMNIFKFNF